MNTNLLRLLSLLAVTVMSLPAIAQTTYIVDSLDDNPNVQAGDRDGLVTLREAVMAANTNMQFGDAPAGGSLNFDVIRFSRAIRSNASIIQLGARLEIRDDVRIEATSHTRFTISGQYRTQIFRVIEDAQLILKRMTLREGLKSGGQGGAIELLSSHLSTDDVEIVNCRAARGGGVSLDGFSSATFTRSTIAFNWATDSGGGVYATDSSIVAFENSTLARNQANYNGGGICLDSAGITIDDYLLQLYSDNSTIVENKTGFGAWIKGNGGGVAVLNWPEHFDGKLFINNTILADNAQYTYSSTTPDDVVGRFANRSAGNLLGAAIPENDINSQTNLAGSQNNPIDPRLGKIQIHYNSSLGFGSTRCYRPDSNSPAVDAGDNNLVPSMMTTDQRGQNRIRYGQVDIGSFER